MTASQIKRILNGIGYATDSTIQTPEIRALIFSTNQGIHHHEEFLNIDSAENIIGIKKYKYTIISGCINANISISKNTLSAKNSIYMKHSTYLFRSPKVGDNVFIVKKDDGTIISDIFKIEKVASSYVTLSGEIKNFNKNEHYIVYADSDYLSSAIQDIKSPALFFIYTPISKHEQDVYLNGEELIGIEMYSSILGSI